LFREGDELPVPVNGRENAATVLLIDEENGSAAETFAMMFQLAKLGPIVGWRTGGGVIGPYGARRMPGLVDGGRVQIPTRAAYYPPGVWPENDGIHPDVAVEILPQDWRAGRDPQLEAAVKAGLEAIATLPTAEWRHPEFPKHP
jgi:tricorn protease